MRTRRSAIVAGIVLILTASMLCSSCAPGQLLGPAITPTPTPPPVALKCDIGTEQYSIKIEGETGQVTTTSNNETTKFGYDPGGQRETITLGVDRTLAFKESGHSYKITGQIVVNILLNTVVYNITASGDGFADKEQVCKNP